MILFSVFSRFSRDYKEVSILGTLKLKDKTGFKVFVFSFLFVFSPLSHAVRVNKVSIEGNKIIETELIRSHIQLKKGSSYNEKTVQKDVRQLFSLGFFDDIEVQSSASKKGLNILYQVKERIHIGEVEFTGNKSVKTEDLKELSLLKEHGFLNFDKLRKTLLAIEEKYKEKAYYLAEVSYKTERIPKQNKLKLIIEIKENKRLFIKRINFIGNRSISSNELKAFMLTKEQSLLSFLGSSGAFNPEHIERDLQFIEYYYRNKGYLNVRVQKPEINITPDKKFLYINFSISEGSRFKLGQVAFRGDEIVPTEKVMDQLSLKKEEYFSIGRLQEDIKLISILYKNEGYAFVEVRPLFFPDKVEEDKIHILFKVERGEMYKIRRIRTLGNKNTRDKVIARRFRVREGELYNESGKELTRQLLQQLGYFEEVDLKPIPSEVAKGELDLLVRVKERESTGDVHLAGGYSGVTRLFIKAGGKKQNFLGLDQSINASLNFNKYQEIFTIGYQSSYFLDSNWNFAFDAFNVAQDALSGSGSLNSLFSSQPDYLSYSQLNTGFSISLGRHLTEFLTVFLKYELQRQDLSSDSIYLLRNLPVLSPVFKFLFGAEETGPGDKMDSKISSDKQKLSAQKETKANLIQSKNQPKEQTDKKTVSEQYRIRESGEPFRIVTFSDVYNLEEGRGLNSSLSAILEYDKRNDRYYASKGFFTRLSAEYSGLGGDFNYTKLQGKFRHYYSPFWKLVIKNRLDYGWVFSNNRKKNVPFTELFLLGGPYNLRGFPFNSQGPRRFSKLAFDYAQQHNEDVKRAQNELPEKRAKLAELQKGDSTKTQKDEIKKIKTEIARDEVIALAKPFEYSEAFAQRPYGSSQMFFYGLELEIPIIEGAGLRGALFFDIGEANNKLLFDLDDQLRANVGVGVRWRSPFGPLSLDWALPYRPRKKFNEKDWEFQFSFGSQI